MEVNDKEEEYGIEKRRKVNNKKTNIRKKKNKKRKKKKKRKMKVKVKKEDKK